MLNKKSLPALLTVIFMSSILVSADNIAAKKTEPLPGDDLGLKWKLDDIVRKSMTLTLTKTGEIPGDENYEGNKVIKISGTGTNNDIYGAWLNFGRILPKKTYKLSLYTKTTKKFPSASEKVQPYLMVSYFKDIEKKERINVDYIPLPRSDNWTLTSCNILIPEETDNMAIGFRIAGVVPSSESIYYSKLEFIRAKNTDASEGNDLPAIDFEDWANHPYKGASITETTTKAVRTTIGTKLAHSGEGYLEMDGSDQASQCDFSINDIAVEPLTTYNLSFFYRTTAKMTKKRVRIMVLQFTDEQLLNNKPFHGYDPNKPEDYYQPEPVPAIDWTSSNHNFTTGKNVRKISIVFCLEFVEPGNKLFLDDIMLEPAKSGVSLQWEIDPKTGILSGAAKSSKDIGGKNITVSITKDGDVVKKIGLKPGESDFSFNLNELPDNTKYYIIAETDLGAKGKAICKSSDKNNLFYTFTKNRFWENNKIGVLDKNDPPPKPWRALKHNANNNAITTWNNTITPGEGLGSIQIDFAEPRQSLFSKPISLKKLMKIFCGSGLKNILTPTLTMNNKKLTETFSFSGLKTSYNSPNKIILEDSGESERATINTTMEVEFDGFIKYRLVIKPVQGNSCKVDNLILRLKFPDDYVKYYYTKDGLTFNKSAYSTDEYYPTFWFGNYENGLLWCAEKLFPAVKKQKTNWLALDFEKDGPILTINLVNQPVELKDAPLVVEFGLQPTPVKPFDPRQRNVKFRSSDKNDSTLHVVGTMCHKVFPYFGYPEITSLEEFNKEIIAGMNCPQASLLYYTGSGYATETIPQMTYFKKEWISTPKNSYTTDHPAYRGYATGDYTTIDMGNSSWLDLCLYTLKKFMEQTKIKGTYNDTAYPSIKEKDGECSCPVFGAREYHKRVYVLLHQMDPDNAWTIYHQGGDTALPYASFADFVLNGEHLYGQMGRYSYYLEFMSLEEFRAMVASPLGPGHMFLPEYWQPEKAKNKALMAQLVGLVMAHDAIMWNANQEVILKMMRQKYNFGDLSKAKWYPYWDKNPYLLGNNDKVKISYYERDGDLFVIPFNTSKDDQEIKIKFLDSYTKKYADRTGVRIYDPVEDKTETRPISNNEITLKLGPYLTKLLSINNR